MADSLAQIDGNDDFYKSWLSVNGNDEYSRYKKETAHPQLSYQDWSTSDKPLAPYLYHLTLNAWDGSNSSSDDESVENVPAHGPDQEPTERVTINGRSLPHVPKATAPIPDITYTKVSEIPVRKRQESSRKSVALETARKTKADAKKTATPSINNKIKSSETPIRKAPQKIRTSTEPTISPEDIDKSTPVADGPSPSSASNTPDGPSPTSISRRGLRTRTAAQQRPYFHNAKIYEDAEIADREPEVDTKSPPQVRTKLAQVSYPNSAEVSGEESPRIGDLTDVTPLSHSPAPEFPFPSEKRRPYNKAGRPWRKGEEDEDEDYLAANKKKSKKKSKGRKSLEKAIAGQTANVNPVPTTPSSTTKPGRKSRKSVLSNEYIGDESDSDAETPPQPPAQPQEQLPTSAIVNQLIDDHDSTRPKRRPRKSYVSEEFVHDDSDSEGIPDDGAIEILESPVPKKEPKAKRRSLKSYKSLEFVQDDSDEELTSAGGVGQHLVTTPATTPVDKGKGKARGRPKKDASEKKAEKKKKQATRGRPRKSDTGTEASSQDTIPIAPEDQDEAHRGKLREKTPSGERTETPKAGSESSVSKTAGPKINSESVPVESKNHLEE
ncbi:hypothetical protein B0J11DRAFT_609638 [Dendryphion nanum]|uniref:Uncharacterized protein n=1 Tax=Dendryphion nanum TaxID=256645 RepID=A0A9P9EJ73_9PLEO|nr:hypothetical protein B0J11DRAFT_609638 [Dendryphion nanum]